MLNLESLNSKLDHFTKPFISLPIIIVLGLAMRIYFTPWHLPSVAPDTFTYLILSLSYSHGDFSNTKIDFLWPAFLSLFFGVLKFESLSWIHQYHENNFNSNF